MKIEGMAVVALLALVLIGLGILVPTNHLTGNAVAQAPCGELGCLEMCEQGDVCSGEDEVCCFTNWDVGVCDLETNCEKIREYSAYQSLEVYQDTVRERPSPIDGGSRFIIPLVVVLGILAYVVWQVSTKDK